MDPEAAYGSSGWQIVSLALLFEGPPFAGEQVAVAVADRLDDLDRQGHLVAVPYSAGPRGLLDALRAEAGLRLFGETGYVSPADAIFRTLGQYPQAASEWLVADPYGNRIEHWFKEYPWAERGALEEFPEGGGVVRVCAGRLGAGWHIEPDTPEDAELLRPDGQLHEITIREEGGRLKYDGFTPVTVEGSSSCDAGGVPVGLFDPAPELPDVPVTKTVRDPLPAEG